MAKAPTFEEQRQRGRALRERVPRSAHVDPGKLQRDPVALLEASSAGRIEALVPLRYGRMLASPFAFYRGSAAIQAHDLAKTPRTGITIPICGDCHLMNFGGFATAERTLVFDINDFDESHPGPWEWDVKRLAASIMVASRHLGIKASAADELLFAALEGYGRRMAACAQKGALELWYDKLTFDELLANAIYAEGRAEIERLIKKASQRTHQSLLPKIAEKKGGRWVMADAPPGLFHIHGGRSPIPKDDRWMKIDPVKAISGPFLQQYLATLAPSHHSLLDRFQVQDFAFKTVGVGSVGMRCSVVLLTDLRDQPLFLQIKEAVPSVLAPHVGKTKSPFKHHGQRVVVGQRMMQAAGDPFLGWSTGPLGRHFYLRQLRDMKVAIDLETVSERVFERYGALCCDTLARAHARAGGTAAEISGYLGKGDRFAEAIVRYANAYADQVERDFEAFRKACQGGRLRARTDQDFAADIGP